MTTYSAPRGRVRNMNRVTTTPVTINQWVLDRYPSCTNSISWRNISSWGNGTESCGSAASIADTVTPGYHKLSKKGGIVMNPLTSIKFEVTQGSGTWLGEDKRKTLSCSAPNDYYQQYRYYLTSGTIGGCCSGFKFPGFNSVGMIPMPPLSHSQGELAALVDEASTSCWNQRGRTESNLWESTAEAHKALSLLPDILLNVYKTLKKNSSALKRAKAAGSAYLAYRYGLKPILSDLEAIQRGLLRSKGNVRRTSRGYASHSFGSAINRGAFTWFGTHVFNYTLSRYEKVNVRAMSLDESRWELMSNVGFTTKGLITLPWELLPYSFVIDWFVNFGDFLGAITPTTSLNQLGSCYVITSTLEYEWSGRVVTFDPTYSSALISMSDLGTQQMRYTVKQRVPRLPVPSLVVKSDFGFDRLTRATDAIALIVQKLRHP